MSYKYVKAPPGHVLVRPTSGKTQIRRGISAVLLTLGIAAFTTVAYPMLVYQFTYATKFRANNLKTPTVSDLESVVEGVKPAVAAGPTFLPEMINTTLDYTDSQVWFPQANTRTASASDEIYTFDIDALGINNAIVKNGHTDLKESLIQYPGTAMPGELGNTVIFGHSVLPQFFDPDNYVSIFSTLHTLDKGETIRITYDSTTYTYQIYDMYEVLPEDLTPLAQSYDAHRLTVITCTPPGTYLRRLIIKAQLIDT